MHHPQAPKSVTTSNFKTMDLTTSKYYQSPSLFTAQEPPFEGNTIFHKQTKGNPFADTFPDPLCKLNLKETSEFVKSFPTMVNNTTETSRGLLEVSAQRRRESVSSATQRRLEAPPTPGRPVFSFSVGNLSRKSFPSKWDDAEKWLISTSCHDSPAHAIKPSLPTEPSKVSRDCDELKQHVEVFAEKCSVSEEKVTNKVSSFQNCVSLDHLHNSARAFNGVSASSADVLLKDKFTDKVEQIFPNFGYSGPTKEGFLFNNSLGESMKDGGAREVVHQVQHRDMGTGMSPLGSTTTSRCHTPLKIPSPARHNTPADRSGPLAMGNSNGTNATIDFAQLQECHLAKLQLGTQYDSVTSNWSSREEEEEQVSKSLRHFEEDNGCRGNFTESRAAAWDWQEEEKIKHCLRYQREEAKIQAWMNLQSAKAEAQSRKLEVKIQKIRSNLEEKLMKRMAVVHRKAEEWRAAAQLQHSEQLQKATEQTQKMMDRHNPHLYTNSSCGCFPCNNNHH